MRYTVSEARKRGPVKPNLLFCALTVTQRLTASTKSASDVDLNGYSSQELYMPLPLQRLRGVAHARLYLSGLASWSASYSSVVVKAPSPWLVQNAPQHMLLHSSYIVRFVFRERQGPDLLTWSVAAVEIDHFDSSRAH